MMEFHLNCVENGKKTVLRLPAGAEQINGAFTRMDCSVGESVEIMRVSSPVRSLGKYLKSTDLGSWERLSKLNALAEKIDTMTERERQMFSGALDAESIGGLDDMLRIADSLDGYEIIPEVTCDRELGGWLVEHKRLAVEVPEAVRPYLDYVGIGAEYYAEHGGAYTLDGYVKRREAAPEQAEEEQSTLRVTLRTEAGGFSLDLPASDAELEDFAQAGIESVTFSDPRLADRIPLDGITVEDANKLALCLREMEHEDGGAMKFCAALEAEEPDVFSEALNIAMDRDGYELVPDNEREYGMDFLRGLGADDEILEAIDGYTDFDQLGRAAMEEDGVRWTEFGLVRRLSSPFPPEPELGPVMS